MIPRLLFLLFVPVSMLSGCGGLLAGDADDPAPIETGDDEHSARFIGPWEIDDTEPHAYDLHALLHFHADGSLDVSDDSSPREPKARLASVSTRAGQCSFRDRWTSVGDTDLFVEVSCESGVKEAHFVFGDPASNRSGAGAEVRLADVDGDREVDLPDSFGWRMSRLR